MLDFALTVTDGNIAGNVAVYPGNGDGTFQVAGRQPAPRGATRGAVAADLNNDGKVDMAFAGGYYFGDFSPIVPVLFGLGGGCAFLPAVDYEVGANARSVAVADLGDGNLSLDLVTANSTNTISLLRSGSPDSPGLIGLGWTPWTIAAADFDGDGFTDLVTANRDSDNAAVLLGLGSGKFESPRPYPLTSRPVPMLVFDLFGNGTPDVVAASTDPGGLALLVNTRLGVAPLAPSGTCAGGSANIRALAGGVGTLTYQWRKDGVPLSDGGHIAGSQTSVLIILTAGPEDEGAYDVVVSDFCGTVTSTATDFVVEDPPPVPSIVDRPHGAAEAAGFTASVAAPIAGHSYTWSITGAVITEGQGTSTVTFTTGLPGTLSLSVEDFSAPGCGTSSAEATVPIDYFDVPPANPFHADIVTIAQPESRQAAAAATTAPTSPVTGRQMAVFLLKSEVRLESTCRRSCDRSSTTSPPGSFAATGSTSSGTSGVTGGCGSQHYCPDASRSPARRWRSSS